MMRSFLLLAVPAALANDAEVCAAGGSCAQDEATLLQLQGLRANLEVKKQKQTPANQIKGCPQSNLDDDYVGGNVRCCSLDGTSCNSGYLSQTYTFNDGSTSEGRSCEAGDCKGNDNAFCHDDVSFHQAAQICRANGERLCTQAEVESSICCGTGCMHNHHNIWFSDSSNPSPPCTDCWDQWEVDNSKCNRNVNLVCVDSQEECQGVAEANGHDWYSFRHNLATNNECNGRHKCFSSAGCDDGLIGDRTNEWRIYTRAPDCRLSAYWEYDSCGCGGNDQNQGWCGGIRVGNCPDTVAVDAGVCPSGTAYLAEFWPKPYLGTHNAPRGTEGHLVRDGCEYLWHAQYACQEPAFDCALSAYWEYGNGGCGGNDQNKDWCGGLGVGDCPAVIDVPTSLCPSGTAYRAVWHPKPYDGTSHQPGHDGHYHRDGVEYIWHAQYACTESINVENGGFEEGFTPQETGNTHTMSGSGYEYTNIFPGWTAAGGTVMVASGNGPWGGIVASSGGYLLALQAAAAEIKQTVSGLRAGQSYTLTVNAAQRTNSPGGTNAALKVSVNGQELMNEVVTSTAMEAQVMTFTADSGTAEIKIENDVASGDQTVFVDGITLTAA